jgi:hypothetical protein
MYKTNSRRDVDQRLHYASTALTVRVSFIRCLLGSHQYSVKRPKSKRNFETNKLLKQSYIDVQNPLSISSVTLCGNSTLLAGEFQITTNFKIREKEENR